MSSNKGLGKGLSALISEQNAAAFNETSVRKAKIEQIEPNKAQPRKSFDEEGLSELAESIKQHGIIQPIIVRSIPNANKYEIIAGERRFRAAKLAGLNELPVVVKDLTDEEVAAQALIENIQRQDLNIVEEADAYNDLMERYNYTQEQLSKVLGKKRSHIANMMRVNNLPEQVREHIISGLLSFGHVKVIASHNDVEAIVKQVVSKRLSVRQTENLLKNWNKNSNKPPKASSLHDSEDDFDLLSQNLTEKLGLNVNIAVEGNRGKVSVNFNNFEQLDTIIELLSAYRK